MGYAILKRWPEKDNKKRGVEGKGSWYCPVAKDNIKSFDWSEEGGWITPPFHISMKEQNDMIAKICKEFLNSSDLEREIKW